MVGESRGEGMAIITLLTDYGMRDSYVAQLKGVLLTALPTVILVDVSHEIPPQDIRSGARVLRESAVEFPAGSIHIAVVDPGVGSRRRIIAAQIADRFFVLPDNGLLEFLLTDFHLQKAVQIPTPSPLVAPSPIGATHQLNPLGATHQDSGKAIKSKGATHRPVGATHQNRTIASNTFHGRDIIAPAAARLAAGVPIQELGIGIDIVDLTRLPHSVFEMTGQTVAGEVVAVDHFGNAITNIPAEACKFDGDFIEVIVESRKAQWPWRTHYGAVEAGGRVALINSQGYLELACNAASASQMLGIQIGHRVVITS